MPYSVALASKQVLKQYRQLPPAIQARLKKHILALSGFPDVAHCRKLSGHKQLYRIRVGDYRVVFEAMDDQQRIVVLLILHRRDVYKKLEQI